MTTEMSAAEQYARLKAEQFETFINGSFTDDALKGVELFEVKADSGMVFKCRRLDQAFVDNAMMMPMALSEQVASAMGKDKPSKTQAAERWNKMSETERIAATQAAARMVRYVCVEPRIIVGDVGNQRNAISADALTMADFGVLASWAQNGGDAAAGLKTFRRKRK